MTNVTLRAVVVPGASAPSSPLIWEIYDESGAVVYDRHETPSLQTDLEPGTYQVWLTRVATGTQHGGPITVTLPGPQEFVFELPQLVPEASLSAPQEALVGTSVSVGWTGPGAPEDSILLATPDRSQSFAQVFPRNGNPLMVTLPDQPGDYLLQYVHPAMNRVLAERTIRALPLPAMLDAPLSAVAGSTIAVTWDGPGGTDDVIAAVTPANDRTVTRALVRDGNPLPLRVPSQAGQYELRYIDWATQRVLATRMLTVTPATATLEAPDSARVGSTIAVGWTGPGYDPDHIVVGIVGEDRSLGRAFVRDGTPVNLQMPSEPGRYELRYLMQDDREVIGSRMITVTGIVATLEAPATAQAGSTIQVHWTGPDYQNDFLGIGPLDDPDGYSNYRYTRDGSPAALVMPTEPGAYEIRYFVNQDRTIIARHAITVTSVGATLQAPDSAEAGATVLVTWQDPDYQNDFLGIGPVDDADAYTNYTYTRDGSPARLEMPTEPGAYEIRYFVNQDRTVIGRHPITITAVTARIEAPDSAPAGDTINVTWQGPDYRNDFLGIGPLDDPNGYETYSYTSDGSPARLEMPVTPGRYEIRYFVNQDRTVIARRDIEVTALSVTVTAPETAQVGETITVTWAGPDYRNDFVAVSNADDDGYENYTYTRDGNPARLVMPSDPGRYEIRYYVNQDRSIQARIPITVTDLEVTLDTESSGQAGGSIMVGHTGPDYRNDFIAIGRPGEDGHTEYTYTRTGNPLRLDLPDEPGDYEIRYVMSQDRRVLARVPFTVTAP